MSFTSLLKDHLNKAYTEHASKTATFPVPTHLYSGSPSSEHLPISRQTLPSLIRLTLPPSPEHTAWGQQRVSAVSSLNFHWCKNRASSIWHTTNTRWRNDQCRRLCILSSLMWTQATCSLSAATAHHPLTLTSVLPVLSPQELVTLPPTPTGLHSTHNDIFSSEKIPGWQVAYSSCCDY